MFSKNRKKPVVSPRKGKAKNVDSQFEAFLKESLSSEESSLDTARVAKYLQKIPKKTEDQPWWMNGDDGDDDDGGGLGLTGTGRSFLKSKRPDPPSTNHVDRTKNNYKQTVLARPDDVNMSRDSLDEKLDANFSVSLRGRESADITRNGGVSVPALALGLDSSQSLTETATVDKTNPGLETLQEMADKEKFFENLEKNSDSTIDFSRLNRDIDKSATLQGTLSSEAGKEGFLPLQKDNEDESDEENAAQQYPSSINHDNTNHLSAKEAEDKKSMLSKVALLDSLDSTLGTKCASQETRPEDMKPIPEGSEYGPDDPEVHDNDHLDGLMHEGRYIGTSHLTDSHMDKTNSDQKGLTLKTGTGGLGYTDTSREIEALHAALRQVGMSTTGSTHDFTLQGNSSIFMGTGTIPGGDSPATDGVTESTPGFGLKAVMQNTGVSQRTVDDIIHEVEELKKTGKDSGSEKQPAVRFRADTAPSPRCQSPVHTQNGMQGFDLSPVHTQSNGQDFGMSPVHTDNDGWGFDMSPVHIGAQPEEGVQSYDLSPLDKFAGHHPLDHGASSGSQPPVPAPREHKPVKKKSKEKFPHVRSSGYGDPGSSPPKKSSASSITGKKSSNQRWSPADTSKQKIKGTDEPTTGGKSVPRPGVDDHMFASVQSFANYIQSHFTSSHDNNVPSMPGVKFSQDGPLLSASQKLPVLERERALVREVKEWQDQWKEERRQHAKLKAEMDNQERDYGRKIESLRLEHEQEMFKLKQENFVLSAKVQESNSSTRRKVLLEGAETEGVNKDQVALLEKEIREQEGLLAGYQAENERLYQEMKKMQTMSKNAEEQMFKENQRLNTEVSSLRQKLDQKEIEMKNRGLITSPAVQQQIAAGNLSSAVLGAGRIAQLETQSKQLRLRDDNHQKEVLTLTKANKELEKYIQQLMGKISEFEEKVKTAKSTQSQEAKDIEARYETEIDRLKRKLKWYAENQELLDRDKESLQKKDEEIRQLKDKLEHITTEHGRRQAEAKSRVKERAVDAKKIQDLQRQVREMEGIIRKRHPNSLPVLMWAANAALEPDGKEGPKKALSTDFLEKRCKKLEAELDTKDEEAKQSLRVMEQKYNNMKFQFEERIESLESTVSKYERPGDGKLKEGEHPHSHMVALQKELDNVRERYKKRIAEFEGETERLRTEISQIKIKETAAAKAEEKAVRESELELQAKVHSLQRDLSAQEQERVILQRAVERLQKEKQQMLTDMARQTERTTRGSVGSDRGRGRARSTSRTRQPPGKKPSSQESLRSHESETSTLPPYPSASSLEQERHYQPKSFTGVHIEDVLKENEQLKIQLDRIQLEGDHSRVNHQKMLAVVESRERRAAEQLEEQLAALRFAHQGELQKVLAEHAMSHSASRVAELQGKVDTQEVMLRHLREQLAEYKVDSERLSMLKIQNTTLETQVTELLAELREACKNHTPEMRHFVALQDQIKKLESRHQHREHELRQIINQSQAIAAADMEREVEKWRKIVDVKNRETEKFRTELDMILEVLKELQRQGVVLPVGSSGAGSSTGSRFSER